MMGRVFFHMNVRQIKYLNNSVDQNHRFIKKITRPMKGLKVFHSDEATLAGIRLHPIVKKDSTYKQKTNPSSTNFMDLQPKLIQDIYISRLKLFLR